MARVLTALGCACGHEAYFPYVERRGPLFLSSRHRLRVRLFTAAWPMPPWGEAAWQAAPFLDALPRGTLVFHQVRHPLAYLRSRQKKGLTYIPFRTRYVPVPGGCRCEADFAALPLERQAAYLAAFWVAWNRMIERCAERPGMHYARYRIEAVDADHMARMLVRIGRPAGRDAVERVLAGTARTVHSLGPPGAALELDMLPPDLHAAVRDLGARYGYTV
ncbi:MAG: hypothetical protein JW951_07995 [Lentisphaerae bacterium]|nr:hypothetical protein [Lentisphaerota bacterium]